jgi:hypothetical protein
LQGGNKEVVAKSADIEQRCRRRNMNRHTHEILRHPLLVQRIQGRVIGAFGDS